MALVALSALPWSTAGLFVRLIPLDVGTARRLAPFAATGVPACTASPRPARMLPPDLSGEVPRSGSERRRAAGGEKSSGNDG